MTDVKVSPYRAIDIEEPSRPRNNSLVPFGSACIRCGNNRMDRTQIGSFSLDHRVWVEPRRYWWQFWRPRIGFHRVRCGNCGARRKEASKSLAAASKTLTQ